MVEVSNDVKTQCKSIVEACEQYLARDVQCLSDCLCDHVGINLTFRADDLWVQHKPNAFNTWPEFTGDYTFPIDHRKYSKEFPEEKYEPYFQPDQLAGEYGKARIRLVKHVISYFKELGELE